MALSVKHADPLHRVSIIPRSIGALGYTLQLPVQERYLMTQEQLEDRIAVLLGGRAAEEIEYAGVISTGAADDLERASELARQMVTRFGMSERLGKATWGGPMAHAVPQVAIWDEERNYSERTAETIDEELRRILGENYARVRELLRANRGPMTRISRALMEKETLERAELNSLLADRRRRGPGKKRLLGPGGTEHAKLLHRAGFNLTSGPPRFSGTRVSRPG